jgi:hypothetical protein
MQNSAAPSAPQLIPVACVNNKTKLSEESLPYRALFKQEKGPVRPVTLSLLAFGTRTSSIKMLPVMLARRDILPSILGALRPFMPFASVKLKINAPTLTTNLFQNKTSDFAVVGFGPDDKDLRGNYNGWRRLQGDETWGEGGGREGGGRGGGGSIASAMGLFVIQFLEPFRM